MKALQYLFTLLILLSVNFFLPRLMPGDPLSYLVADPGADAPFLLTEEMREELLTYYGLDKPLAVQYLDYLKGLARGDLGWSIYFHGPVSEILLSRLKWTLFLSGSATLIYVTLGVLLGAVSARKRGTPTDVGLLVSVLSLGSWPAFFLGMLLIIFLSVKLAWFPIGGAMSPAAAAAGGVERVRDIARHWFLPALTLVLTNLPGIYFLTRNAMLGTLGAEYIRTARAKGIRESRLLLRHAVPNALLPIVTAVAMRLGFMIMGAMFVEVVFSYPGMGTLVYQASMARDYPLLQGAFLTLSLGVVLCNFATDMLYARLDPRVRTA